MRVLVTGASGQLGGFVLDRLAQTRQEVIAWSGPNTEQRNREPGQIPWVPVDLNDLPAVQRKLGAADPEIVLHLAALSRVDLVRQDPDLARRMNVESTGFLADWCRLHHRRFLFTSTDLVFDGSLPWWREDDLPSPLMAYGRTKYDAENLVKLAGHSLIVRLSLLFGISKIGKPTFFDSILQDLRSGQARELFQDEFRTPLNYESAAEVLVALLDRPDIEGILHVAGVERLSRFDLIMRAAKAFGLDHSLVLGNRQKDTDSPEPRPTDVSLDTTKLCTLLPNLHRPTIEQWSASMQHHFEAQDGFRGDNRGFLS